MPEEIAPETNKEQISEERRAFLTKARKTAVAAPAAALLLAATAAQAKIGSGPPL
jgi:hypothetical protein